MRPDRGRDERPGLGGWRRPARHAAVRLARFKQPARLEVVDALPRTVTGKVAQGRLRERVRRGAPGLLE